MCSDRHHFNYVTVHVCLSVAPINVGPLWLSVLTVTPIDRLHKSDGPNGVKGAAKEDKIWDKAWRAQQAHVHGPIKGQAHSLCGAPDRMRAQTYSPRFRFLKTCSARKGLGPQGQDLLYKKKTCSARKGLGPQEEDLLCKDKTGPTRRRLALQGKEQRLHYYKSPNILLT